MKYTLVDCLLS